MYREITKAVPKEYDENGHKNTDPRFCAYTYSELKNMPLKYN